MAENSEDAGTLQALKTMDSLESKIQQVKTSMEQFYSSMGIEKFLKGTLTTVDTVIKNVNKMTKPQAFMTLINLFKGAKTMVLGGFQLASNKFGELKGQLQDLKNEAASGTQINLENTTAKGRIEELKKEIANLQARSEIKFGENFNKSYGNLWASKKAPFNANAAKNWLDGKSTKGTGRGSEVTKNYLDAVALASGHTSKEVGDILKNELGNKEVTQQAIEDAIKKQPGFFGLNDKKITELTNQLGTYQAALKQEKTQQTSLALNRISGILTSIGATLTTWALTWKDKSTDSVEGSKLGSGAGSILSGTGGALGAVASGLMIGTPFGKVLAAVGALVNGLPGIVSGITQLADGLDYNTAEKLAAATSEAEESKTEALKKKSEERNLKNDLERLRALEAAQYDSAEAQQEYVDYMNQLADTYPNLVDSLKLTGDATITAIDMENALQEARKASAVAAAEAAKDEAERAKKEADNYKELHIIAEKALQAYNGDEFGEYVSSTARTMWDIGQSRDVNTLVSFGSEMILGGEPIDADLLAKGFSMSSLGDVLYTIMDKMLKETDLDAEQLFGISSLDDLFDEEEGLNLEALAIAWNHFLSTYDDIVAVAEETSDLADKASFKADIIRTISQSDGYAGYSDAAVELASRIFSDAATAAEGIVDKSGEINYDEATKQFEKLYKDKGAEIFAALMGPNGEALFELVDNLDKYTPSDLKSKLKSLNFAPDEDPNIPDIGDWVIQEQAERYKEAQNLIAGKVKQLSQKIGVQGSIELGTIRGLFDGYENFIELPWKYADFFLPMLNQAESYFDNSLFAQGRAYLEVISSLGTALGDIDDEINSEDLQALEAAFAKLDLTSANSIQALITQIEEYAASQEREKDFEPLINSLQGAMDILRFNIVTETQAMSEQLKEAAENTEKLFSSAEKGFDLSDAMEQYQTIISRQDFKDLKFDEIFKFDEAQNTWVMTYEGLNTALAVQRKSLEDSVKSTQKAIDQVSKLPTAEDVDIDATLYDQTALEDAIGENGIIDYENKAVKKLKDALTGTGLDGSVAEDLIKGWINFTGSWETYIKQYLSTQKVALNQAEALIAANRQSIISIAYGAIDWAGLGAGTADIKTQAGFLAKALQAKFDWSDRFALAQANAILESGAIENLDLPFEYLSDYYEAGFSKYSTAISELLEGSGTQVNETTRNLLGTAAIGMLDDSGTRLIASADECVEAALRVYEGMKNAFTTTSGELIGIAELNSTYAGILKAATQKKASGLALGAGILDYASFGEILATYGKTLSDYIDQDTYEVVDEYEKYLKNDKASQSVKIKADSFEGFKEAINSLLGDVVASDTEEYKKLYASYVDTQIAEDTSQQKRLESQLQALSGAKIGDTINVSELAGQGLFESSQYTVDSMKQLYVDLSRIAASGNADIQSSISIIEEALASLFESWASAIAAGLGGTLSASQAEGLKKSFNLNDFDFTETAEGLQLSRAAAFEVYEQLEKIDKVKSKLVFDELANNLSETDENYANISKIMSRINELDSNVPTGRSKEYATELKLAQDILKTRSMTDADSFKLMDQDLPEAMQGPVNAWESMYKGYNAVNEGLKSGKMGVEDFYNFANNIVPMMEQAGVKVFDASISSADLIEKGFSALKYIDGEGLQVSLGDLGLNFEAGAADMQDGFKAGFDDMADSQIAMLDAAINMLEAIVAMEEIAGVDGEFSLGEIFTLDGDGNVTGWTEGAQNWFKKFEALNGAVMVGNQTLQEFLFSLGSTEEGAQSVLAIFKELSSMDWGDGSDSFERLQTVLGQYTNQDITIGESIFQKLGIPRNASQESKEFKKWLEDTGLNIEQAEAMLETLSSGDFNARLRNSKGELTDRGKAISKMLGLSEESQKLFEGFIGDNKISVEELQLWTDVEITENADGEVTEATYTASNGQKMPLDLNNPGGWKNQIAQWEQNLKDARGQFGTGTELTLGENGKVISVVLHTGVKLTRVLESENGSEEFEDGQGNRYSSYEDYLEKEYLKNRKITGVNEQGSPVFETREEYEHRVLIETTTKPTIINKDGDTRTTAQKILSTSNENLQKILDEHKGEDGTIVIPPELFGSEVVLPPGSTVSDLIALAVTESGIDTNLVDGIVAGISKAFEGDAGSKIGEAIKQGIENSFKTSSAEGTTNGYPIGEITLAPTTVKVDASAATIEPTEGELGLTNPIPEVKATADKITITLATNYEATPGSVATGLEYATGEGTAEEVSVSSNSYKDANGTIIDDIKYALVNGNTNTITITAKKHKDSDQSPDLGDYTGTPTATADNAKVTVQEYEVTFTDQDGNVTKTLTVSGIAELGGVLGGIAGLTKNSEGNYQLAETIDNLVINIVMPNYDEMLKLIESLTGNKDLTIKTTYVDANGNPTVNPNTTNDRRTGPGGYQLVGINNGTPDFVFGSYDTYDQAEAGARGYIDSGLLNEGEYSIETINVEGATVNISDTNGQGKEASSTVESPTVTKNGASEAQGEPIDTSAFISALQKINAGVSLTATSLSSLGTAIAGIQDKSEAVSNTADAINKLRDKKVNVHVQVPTDASFTVKADVKLDVSSTGAVRVSSASLPNPQDSKGNFTIPVKSNVLAKGNVALAQGSAAANKKRTLVGELGPELVVSDGHYYTVGNAGAEFVDLPDDAIVFNHIQTRRLLGKKRGGIDSRGVPITNERRAVAFARGGETGPAMASAKAVLAQLKQLRAMWQAMKDASASDLGSKAGGGSGGGGGGGGADDAFIADIDRWYNLVRQIDNLEQHINLEEAKRKNLIDGYAKQGYAYADSLERQLDYLKDQQRAYKELASLQRDYYDKRQQELANSKYAQIFTYNEEGLQQYTQGENKGLRALAYLNQQDAYGAAKLTPQQQYNYLVDTLGFTFDELKTDSSGKTADKKDYATLVQNFFDNVDAWKDELDSLWDEVADGLQNIEDNQAAQQEILQQFTDNQLSVEDAIMTALTDMRQEFIDDLQKELDELQDAGDKYINDLTDALDREREMYEDSQRERETASLQTQLAILKRTGASASSIRSLESQLDNRYQEDYFNEQQDQIDKVQESLDTQIERMEEQIKIETESLEYQKKNGLLWDQVYSMMATWSEGQLAQFIQEGTQSFHEKSPLGLQEEMKTILQQIQIYLEKSASDAYDSFLSKTGFKGDDELKEAFMAAYGESRNIETATQAAQAIIAKREEEQRPSETPLAPPEPEQSTFNVVGTGKVKTNLLNVRSGPGTSYENLGGVNKDQTVELLGVKGSWYKIVYNGQEAWVSTKWVSVKDDVKKKLPQFSKGGMVDFTGPAMVHGTKSKPEAFIDAEDTALLKSTIFSKSNNSLRAMIDSLNQFIDNISHHSGTTNENIVIENISLNFESGVISNDYSAKRAGQTIKEEILSIARKAGNWSR